MVGRGWWLDFWSPGWVYYYKKGNLCENCLFECSSRHLYFISCWNLMCFFFLKKILLSKKEKSWTLINWERSHIWGVGIEDGKLHLLWTGPTLPPTGPWLPINRVSYLHNWIETTSYFRCSHDGAMIESRSNYPYNFITECEAWKQTQCQPSNFINELKAWNAHKIIH